MAHETTALLGLDTALVDVLYAMAFRAIVHLHSLPRFIAQAGNVLPPDIATVTGDAVLFVNPCMFGLTDMAVAIGTLHFTGNYMGRMGEIYAIRLA